MGSRVPLLRLRLLQRLERTRTVIGIGRKDSFSILRIPVESAARNARLETYSSDGG